MNLLRLAVICQKREWMLILIVRIIIYNTPQLQRKHAYKFYESLIKATWQTYQYLQPSSANWTTNYPLSH